MATRVLNDWLVQLHTGPWRRLDGWRPMRVGQPLDVVVVVPDAVHVWVVPRRSDIAEDYCVRGIADRVTVVVPEREVPAIAAAVPQTYGVLAVGTVAGNPVMLEIRAAARLETSNAAALGELLGRDELAAGLARLGRRVSPFSIRSDLLSEVLDVLPPDLAREWILQTLISG